LHYKNLGDFLSCRKAKVFWRGYLSSINYEETKRSFDGFLDFINKNSEIIKRGCGKIRFVEVRDAKKMSKKVSKQRNVKLYHYKCDVYHGYHLSKQKNGNGGFIITPTFEDEKAY